MKKFVAPLLIVAALVAAPIVSFADERMQTISVGNNALPIRIALIIYSQTDPGATEEHFYLDNPELVSKTVIEAGGTFVAPVGNREST
ncbi:MAG: hypothetical protein ACI9SY_000309 [Candidatus Paceibacteria bacterium]|jgi:hypothetical protein